VTQLPSVCILAGGLGTRLGEQVADTPKPLLPVAGEPFLLHQLRLLAAHGAEHVVLCVGYRGDQIEEEIGPDRFGIRIDYSHDAPELDGTLGAIRRARPLLPDCFLVLYGDTYLRLDYGAAASAWLASGMLGLMTVYRNDDRYDTSNVVYENSRIVLYSKTLRSPAMRWIDYGLGGLRSEALAFVDEEERDLSALYQELSGASELFGYEATERFYEIGTPSSLAEAAGFLESLAAQSDEG
jgi:NDP-sugar pyrophosphorylase family protein